MFLLFYVILTSLNLPDETASFIKGGKSGCKRRPFKR